MYVDIFEEMMRMMQETSKAKRKLIHKKPVAARVYKQFLASGEQKNPVWTMGTSRYRPSGKRVHLHRMPYDPEEMAREKAELHHLLKTGDLKAVILAFPCPVQTPPVQRAHAGVARS
jgi:hypothetical protein